MKLTGGIAPESVAELRQRDVVVIYRRHILRLVEVVHRGQAEKPAGVRVYTGGFEGVAVGVEVLILPAVRLLLLILLRQVAQLIQNRLLVAAQLRHLHGQQLVLFIVGPQQIALQLPDLLGHLVVLLHRHAEAEQLFAELDQEDDDPHCNSHQHQFRDDQHDPLPCGKAPVILADQLQPHREVEQVVHEIKE